MGSTYTSLHFHIVFGTKSRVPSIDTKWGSRLHEYLGGTLTGLQATPQGIGGIVDHVHMLVGLKASHCLADVVRELKKASSVWVHQEIGLPSFAWQVGYAAFSVSSTARSAVRTYIANQEAHHRGCSYQEELIEMLERAGVEFDPKYLE